MSSLLSSPFFTEDLMSSLPSSCNTEDLKHQYTVTSDEFLNDVLCLAPDWINENASQIDDIVHNQCFGKLVSECLEPETDETSRYPPFIHLANHVMSQLNSNPDSRICFCCNDPVLIDHSQDRPDKTRFWWTEVSMFFDFKIRCKNLVRDAGTSDSNPTVVPMTSNSPVGVPPSQSTSDEPSIPCTFPVMATRSASHPSITSASESLRSSTTFPSRVLHRPKGQRAGSTASTDHSMSQCASDALGMLSHDGIRSHAISALVTGDTIQLLCHDHSIIVISKAINFLEEPSQFVAMLQAISNLTLPQLGYADIMKPIPLLYEPRQTPDMYSGLELTLSNGTRLVLSSTIYHQRGIIGRGTCVVRATYTHRSKTHGEDMWDVPPVVKLSWPVKSKIPKNDILVKIYNAADHDEHRWVLKHLPNVLHVEDRHINLLSRALIDRLGDRYEERLLRITVQEELYPITERTVAVDLAQSFREIFKCYRWLYEVPKILHCNINPDTLMLRKKGGHVYGVLTDFDLAVSADVKTES